MICLMQMFPITLGEKKLTFESKYEIFNQKRFMLNWKLGTEMKECLLEVLGYSNKKLVLQREIERRSN